MINKRFTALLVMASIVLTPLLNDLQAQTHKRYRKKKAVAADTTSVLNKRKITEGDCETAKIEGAREGSRETNSFAWGTVSFLFPLPGIIVASVADPGMPSQAALSNTDNKTCFIEGYRNKKKSGRLGAAIVGGLLGVVTIVVIIASSSHSSSQ